MKKRILLMLKLSDTVDSVFPAALEMAQECNARLNILHVLDHRLRAPGITDAQIAGISRTAEDRFWDLYGPQLRSFKSYYFNCWEGDPANEASKLAREIGADFIVLGCHRRDGRPSFNRLGEVGLAVLQWAPCPVVLVPCSKEHIQEQTP